MTRCRPVGAILIFLWCLNLMAQDDYTLDWHTLNTAGGGKIEGGPYAIRGSLAQTAMGSAESTDYSVTGGFSAMPLFIPACMPYPTAQVSGNDAICSGESTTLEVALTGAPPWQIAWADGHIDADVTESPWTRVVSPITTTVYGVSYISDANCEGIASGAARIDIVPFDVVIDPVQATLTQGLSVVSLTGASTCDETHTERQWSIPATGTLYPLNQSTITVDPPIPGVTVFQFTATHLVTSETRAATRVLLTAVNPAYFDLNGDGHNDAGDLFQLAQSWRLSFPSLDDPNGDGTLDIRDFLFINLDDQIPPVQLAATSPAKL